MQSTWRYLTHTAIHTTALFCKENSAAAPTWSTQKENQLFFPLRHWEAKSRTGGAKGRRINCLGLKMNTHGSESWRCTCQFLNSLSELHTHKRTHLWCVFLASCTLRSSTFVSTAQQGWLPAGFTSHDGSGACLCRSDSRAELRKVKGWIETSFHALNRNTYQCFRYSSTR